MVSGSSAKAIRSAYDIGGRSTDLVTSVVLVRRRDTVLTRVAPSKLASSAFFIE